MSFLKIMVFVVFNLITTPSKSDNIRAIIKIRRIKYGFMRVTSQILKKKLDALETR